MIAIEEELKRLGPLQNVAAAVLDYVRLGASQSKSEFHRYGCEWTLEPDNWINLNFIYTPRRHKKIQVSLGVFPATLSCVTGIKIKKGKYSSWTRITIGSVLDFPSALRCIEIAYYESKNGFWSKNGAPAKPQPA